MVSFFHFPPIALNRAHFFLCFCLGEIWFPFVAKSLARRQASLHLADLLLVSCFVLCFSVVVPFSSLFCYCSLLFLVWSLFSIDLCSVVLVPFSELFVVCLMSDVVLCSFFAHSKPSPFT